MGVLGTGLKLGALALLHDAFGFGSVAATAVAVECSMLHNFAWHTCWTWADRSQSAPAREVGARLLRFQLSNGAVALVVNLASVPVLVDQAGLNSVLAGTIASLLGGAVNFVLSDLWVFNGRETAGAGSVQ